MKQTSKIERASDHMAKEASRVVQAQLDAELSLIRVTAEQGVYLLRISPDCRCRTCANLPLRDALTPENDLRCMAGYRWVPNWSLDCDRYAREPGSDDEGRTGGERPAKRDVVRYTPGKG